MSFESSAYGLGNTSEEVRNPITSFNFVLEVEGVYFLPLKSVRAFTKEHEYEYIKEGGVNDYVHMKRKPISKPFTFQVERYVGTERFLDPLANGTELILPLILHVYRHAAMRGFTALPDASPARLYTFTGCTVISKEYGELNSERSGILTEVTTIAYRELMVVTNTFTSSEKEKWDIGDGTNTKVKFASQSKLDKVGGIYTKDKDGNLVRVDDEKVNKPAWTGDKGTTVSYAEQAKTDKDDNYPYIMRDIGDQFTWIKRNHDPLFKPPWTGEDGTQNLYAKPQPVDQDKDTYPYEQGDVGDITNTWIMKDNRSFKKTAWDGSKGSKNSHAKPQLSDKDDSFPYKKGDVGNISNTWIMKEGKSFAKPQYSYKTDGVKNKYAIRPKLDDERAVAKGPWTGEKGSTPQFAKQANTDSGDGFPYRRVDIGNTPNTWAMKAGVSLSKPQYSLSEDGVNNLYAERPELDDKRAEAKEPWTGESGTKNKWAKSQSGSVTANSKEPWTGESGAANKWATSQKSTVTTPPKEQYEMKKDGTRNKWAKVSPTDSERAPQVIWPPTRRALMADTLSKK